MLGKRARAAGVLRWAAGAVAVAALAGACTAGGASTAGSAGSAGGGGPVVVAYNNKINSLDPVRADYQQGNLVMQGLYDTLVTYDADNRVVGRLAETATPAADATSVAIHLRSGVAFHDGTAVTAKDVAYSLDRYKRLGVGVASYLANYAGTEVTSDTDLTIRLTKPDSRFLGGLSQVYVLNSALVTANAGTDDAQAWLSGNDAGSGPYRLDAARQGDTITVARNDSYWEFDAARPERLVYRLITESATQRDELRAGTVDVAASLTAPDAKTLDGAEGVAVQTVPVRTEAVVVFNMVTGPTTNPALRQAIRLAYDYQGGLTGIRGGGGELASGPLPTTMGCRPQLPTVSRNLDAARALVVDNGLTGTTLTMNFQPTNSVWQQEATLLQSDLAEIGITLNLEPIAFPDYLARLGDRSRIPQMMLLEDFAQLPVPGDMLTKQFLSTATGTNRSGYANPQVDALLNEAIGTADEAQACTLYAQAQTRIDADAVTLPMYTLQKPFGHTTRVSGVHPAVVGSGPWIPDLRVG